MCVLHSDEQKPTCVQKNAGRKEWKSKWTHVFLYLQSFEHACVGMWWVRVHWKLFRKTNRNRHFIIVGSGITFNKSCFLVQILIFIIAESSQNNGPSLYRSSPFAVCKIFFECNILFLFYAAVFCLLIGCWPCQSIFSILCLLCSFHIYINLWLRLFSFYNTEISHFHGWRQTHSVMLSVNISGHGLK